MKLKLATKWIDETFEEDSKPSIEEVRKWVVEEKVPGRLIDEVPFVYADRFAYCDSPIYQKTSDDLSVDTLLG